jgi:low temperature requirement protein LtrA
MPRTGFLHDLRRPADGPGARRVGYFELFFDLVFVFAITQQSHLLIAHPGFTTLLETVIIGIAVWWVWVDTAWVTNWLDPERGGVRGMLVLAMLVGLVLSGSIPDAFGEKGLLFAVCLVVLQVARPAYVAVVLRRVWPENAANFVRIAIWEGGAGILWVVGGLASEEHRLPLWAAAVALDLLGPATRFALPVLGRSALGVWNVRGEHIAERVSLFIIIALGESIIVTGESFAEGGLTPLRAAAFVAAFVGTVLLWFLFFNHGEALGTAFIVKARSSGVVARLTYTYVPVLLVTGIVLTAVGDDLVLAHPLAGADDGRADAWSAGIVCGATALYLLGNLLFKTSVGEAPLFSHLLGVAGLAVLYAVHPAIAPLAVSWLATAVLLAVVLADERRFRRGRAEGADPDLGPAD